MQENLTIARPYAQAAFAHAQGEGSIPAWSDALAYLSAVVRDDEMRRVISDPRVGRQRAVDLLLEVGGAKFTTSFRNFVKVLSASHRLGIVPVGEAAIYVGVRSSHRSDGFHMLAEFMDELKKDVPIWKMEALERV